MERKAYLVRYSFRNYMIAAVMSMAAMNLNSIIDSILMGNLLGADALSAINVVLPAVSCISAIGILFSQGPAIRIAQYLGAMKKDRANQVFTVSIISMLIVCLLFTGIVTFFNLSEPIVSLLCVASELTGLAQRYGEILMAGAILLIFQNGLSELINVMGNPRVVTIAMVINMGVNILFDILTIKVFGMDIAGAAYATLIAALVSDIIFIVYILKYSDVKLSPCPEWLTDLVTGVANSLPGVIASLSAVALMFICNCFIMKNQGSNGMFVMSIGYTMISIGSMISNGVGMSYAAIGGMLIGQEDYTGIRLLFRRGFLVTIIAPAVFNITGLFSRSLALAYGADTQALLDLSQSSIPLICTLLFALGIISSMIYLHTVLGHKTVSTFNSLMILAVIAGAFAFMDSMFPPEKIWYAFPLTTALSLVIFFAETTVISLKAKNALQLVSLIPKKGPEGDLLDISVECNMEKKSAALDVVIAFLRDHGVKNLENEIIHFLDELMMNIVTYSGSGDGAYMDLVIILRNEKLIVTLKSDGKPFDPTLVRDEDKKFGLRLVFHYCKNMEYRYSYGQNMVFASWNRNEDLVHPA